jgi:hypothetical protein
MAQNSRHDNLIVSQPVKDAPPAGQAERLGAVSEFWIIRLKAQSRLPWASLRGTLSLKRWCLIMEREIESVKTPLLIVVLFLPIIVAVAYGQAAVSKQAQIPIETDICKIMDRPWVYNNKVVKIRGYVETSLERAVLLSEVCPENGIWFSWADASTSTRLVAPVPGGAVSGSRDSKGRVIPPIEVHLVKNSDLEELQRYWAASEKGKSCADGPPPAIPPDCTTYRVTATFTGRIDGVSKQIHAAHLKRSSNGTDWKGFGQMGMYDAQIVIQSVDRVVAEKNPAVRNRSTE